MREAAFRRQFNHRSGRRQCRHGIVLRADGVKKVSAAKIGSCSGGGQIPRFGEPRLIIATCSTMILLLLFRQPSTRILRQTKAKLRHWAVGPVRATWAQFSSNDSMTW